MTAPRVRAFRPAQRITHRAPSRPLITRPLIVTVAGSLDEELRSQMAAAVGGEGEARFAGDTRELAASLAAQDGPRVVVVRLGGAGDEELASAAVEWIRREAPFVPVIGYGWLTPETATHILRLAALGVDAIALHGYNELRPMIRDALHGSGLAPVARETWRAIERDVPADLRAFFQYTLVRAGTGITVAEVAAGLGVHARTLGNRLRRAGLPRPERAIGWCRMLVVARVLDQSDAPIERVALRLGFASGSALNGMIRSYVGLTPGALRRERALAYVARAFVAECGGGELVGAR